MSRAEVVSYFCARALLDTDSVTGACVFGRGIMNGARVLELIESVERVTGRPVPRNDAPRRPGDPPALMADSRRAREQLQWSPRYQSLDSIVETAWQWHQAPSY